MRIDVRDNFAQVKGDLDRLQRDIREKAIARALNRTAEQAKTAMVRTITSEFAIKASEVRPLLSIRQARGGAFGSALEATLEALRGRRGRGLNVIRFGARPAPGRGRKLVKFRGSRGWAQRVVPVGGGVAVRIKKGGGRKTIAHAFIGNDGRTVFIRTGDDRLPIRGVTTVDVPQMFNTKRINAAVVKVIREKFPEVLARETRFYVERFGR